MSPNDNYIKNDMIIIPNSNWKAIFTFCPRQQLSCTHASCLSNVTSHYLKEGKYVAVIDFYSTFHVFDGAACPFKPSRPIPLDPVSHGNDGLFYYNRTALSMDYQHFPPDRLKSRSYQINSGWWRSEYWLSHTFKRLKLFHINS